MTFDGVCEGTRASFFASFSWCGRTWLAGSVLLALLTGCSSVEPWQRGDLARPEMALESNPQDRAWRDHVRMSREATASGAGAEVSGCGCY